MRRFFRVVCQTSFSRLAIFTLCAALFCQRVEISPAAAEGTDALVTSGKQIFAQYCASCHGLDGRGGGPLARVLKTPPRDLTAISARRGGSFPREEIISQIDGRSIIEAHGPRDMPVWGRQFSADVGGGSLGEEVSAGKIQALISYLQSIQGSTIDGAVTR